MEENALPSHIAIIMDGNRRWANERGLSHREGHKAGADTLEKISKYANKIGIKYLTVYAFSTENWKRSEDEVSSIMLLVQKYLDDFSKRANTENIKINIIGDLTKLNDNTQKSMQNTMERTKSNTGLVLNIAFNYGGRAEITRAVKNIAQKVKDEEINIDDINEQLISDNLYTKEQPDPNILIRTSGEIRTSNFLPWQIVYTEIYPIKKYWPDFTEQDLLDAIEIYKNRKKNYGK